MDKPRSIADLSVKELLAAIGSSHVSPGAGAAGAVALGLAAACLGKAATISLKHRPNNSVLQEAVDTCAHIARLALLDADRDAEEFAQFIRTQSSGAAARLVDTAEALRRVGNALQQLADRLQPHVEVNMLGDVSAARALAEAAEAIHARNENEASNR